MDCEKFDRVVLDLLYGELDELTAAAARRHVEHCSRCKGVSAGLRATREVGALPLIDPPEGLELAILEAERRLNATLPLRQKLGRGISILAVYAMRPQLAMAALLLLMIGASLFFVRGRPGSGDSVLVTERGVPESEVAEHVAIVPQSAPPAEVPVPLAATSAATRASSGTRNERGRDEGERSAGSVASDKLDVESKAAAEAEPLPGTEPAADSIEAALAAYQGGRYVEAQRRFEEIAARGGEGAPAAALQAVEALRRQRGCPAAAPRYEDVHSRYRDTPAGSEAAWHAGDCYRALGELARARHSLEALLEVAEYRSRAEAALAELATREEQVMAARKAKASVSTGAPAAAAGEAKPAAPAKPSP